MDESAFTERTRACADRLFRISYLILRNEADCEDAMQEALMKAWSHLGSLKEQKLFETWLTRILINECKRLARKRAKRMEGELPDALATPEPKDKELRDAIRALPMKYRLPLILHHLAGYTQEEVSVILKAPLPATKSRLHRARKQLRAELEGDMR